MAILLLHKIEFKTTTTKKKVIRSKEGYFIMTEVLMHQEGTEIMSTHAPHNSAPRIHDAKPGRPAKGIVINSGK